MSKPEIIIADPDDEYVAPVMLKIAEKLGDRALISVITRSSCLEDYFSVFREIAVLIIDEKWAETVDLSRQNIRNIFLLSEKEEGMGSGSKSNVHAIYKYTSVKEIYNEIYYVCAEEFQTSRTAAAHASVVAVYSPAGGSGKTSLAMGLAAALAEYHKKVLYVDAEYMQTYQWMLQEDEFLPSRCVTQILKNEGYLFDVLKPYIRNRQFDYLPPFSNTISSFGLNATFFQKLIAEIKKQDLYDFIIVDTDSTYDETKRNLFDLADKVLLVAGEGKRYASLFKTLKQNLNYNDKSKYLIILNEMRHESDPSYREESGINYDVQVEYPSFETYEIEQICQEKGIRKIALMMI